MSLQFVYTGSLSIFILILRVFFYFNSLKCYGSCMNLYNSKTYTIDLNALACSQGLKAWMHFLVALSGLTSHLIFILQSVYSLLNPFLKFPYLPRLLIKSVWASSGFMFSFLLVDLFSPLCFLMFCRHKTDIDMHRQLFLNCTYGQSRGSARKKERIQQKSSSLFLMVL